MINKTWAIDPQSANHKRSYSKLEYAVSYISCYTTRYKQYLIYIVKAKPTKVTPEVHKIINFYLSLSSKNFTRLGSLYARFDCTREIHQRRERETCKNPTWPGTVVPEMGVVEGFAWTSRISAPIMTGSIVTSPSAIFLIFFFLRFSE